MGWYLNDNRVSGGGIFEADTVHCRHCQAALIFRRGEAQGAHWCDHCKGPVCSTPQCVICVPWQKKIDEQLNRAERLRQMGIE